MKHGCIPSVAEPAVVILVFTLRAPLVPAFGLRVAGFEALLTRVVRAVGESTAVEVKTLSWRESWEGFYVPAIVPATVILPVLALIAAVAVAAAIVGSGHGEASAEEHSQADQRKLHGH